MGLPIPPVVKTLYNLCEQVFIYHEEVPCPSYTSCAKVAILLLQDLSTLCVTDIYSIYFHLSIQFLYFLLYGNSLKKFFVSERKFNCFKKMSIFSYSLPPKILKLRRSSLRLVFLIKIVYNQFLLLKIIDYGIE